MLHCIRLYTIWIGKARIKDSHSIQYSNGLQFQRFSSIIRMDTGIYRQSFENPRTKDYFRYITAKISKSGSYKNELEIIKDILE